MSIIHLVYPIATATNFLGCVKFAVFPNSTIPDDYNHPISVEQDIKAEVEATALKLGATPQANKKVWEEKPLGLSYKGKSKGLSYLLALINCAIEVKPEFSMIGDIWTTGAIKDDSLMQVEVDAFIEKLKGFLSEPDAKLFIVATGDMMNNNHVDKELQKYEEQHNRNILKKVSLNEFGANALTAQKIILMVNDKDKRQIEALIDTLFEILSEEDRALLKSIKQKMLSDRPVSMRELLDDLSQVEKLHQKRPNNADTGFLRDKIIKKILSQHRENLRRRDISLNDLNLALRHINEFLSTYKNYAEAVHIRNNLLKTKYGIILRAIMKSARVTLVGVCTVLIFLGFFISATIGVSVFTTGEVTVISPKNNDFVGETVSVSGIYKRSLRKEINDIWVLTWPEQSREISSPQSADEVLASKEPIQGWEGWFTGIWETTVTLDSPSQRYVIVAYTATSKASEELADLLNKTQADGSPGISEANLPDDLKERDQIVVNRVCNDNEMRVHTIDVTRRLHNGQREEFPLDQNASIRIERGDRVTVTVNFSYHCPQRKIRWDEVSGKDRIDHLAGHQKIFVDPNTGLEKSEGKYKAMEKGSATIRVLIHDERTQQELKPLSINLDIE